MIYILETRTVPNIDGQVIARYAHILIVKDNIAYTLGVGGLPLTGELLQHLNEQEQYLWEVAVEKNHRTDVSTELRKLNARTEAIRATELRTVTPSQAVDWIETNVTNLANAKVVLKIMVRMLIAMRDQIWPDLPE